MGERKSFEQEVHGLLIEREVAFDEFCDDYHRLAFCIDSPQRSRYYSAIPRSLAGAATFILPLLRIC